MIEAMTELTLIQKKVGSLAEEGGGIVSISMGAYLINIYMNLFLLLHTPTL